MNTIVNATKNVSRATSTVNSRDSTTNHACSPMTAVMLKKKALRFAGQVHPSMEFAQRSAVLKM